MIIKANIWQSLLADTTVLIDMLRAADGHSFRPASVGWRISEESFIKDNFKFVDNLKLRFSAGRSGQDAGDPFQYFSGYTLNSGGYVFSQGNYTNGVASPVMINKNLTWIKVNMYNIGIDFSIFNRLIAVEFDIYQRDRSGLLADRYGSLPNTFGSKLPQENLNGDRTRGIEFTLTHTNKIGDFHYSVSGNFNLARTQRRYIESGPYKSSMEDGETRHPTAGEILSGGIRRTDVSRTLTRLIHIRFRMGITEIPRNFPVTTS